MRKAFSLLLLGAFLLVFAATAGAQVIQWIQNDDGTIAAYAGYPQPNDTVAVSLQPPAAGKLLAAKFNFYGGHGGPAQVYVWRPAATYNPSVYMDYHFPGDAAPTPLGTPWAGPIPYVFNNGGGWQTLTFATYGFTPDMMNVGDSLFFVGYKLNGGAPFPYDPSINMDAGASAPFKSLAYLTNPQNANPNEPGWWAFGRDVLIRAQINMYGDPPPTITGLLDRPDTYLAGPYSVTAYVRDYAQGGSPGVLDSVRLQYSIMGSPEWTSIPMTNTGDSTYTASIPAQGPYTIISYRVAAYDNANHVTLSPGESGYNFSYLQPSGAKILLVNDNSPSSQLFYTNALSNAGYAYDLWVISPGDPNDQGYPGTDVFNHEIYTSILWFTGTANSGSLPDSGANLSQDPVALYMSSGGNFFLSSSDYLGKGLTGDPNGYWTEFSTTAPGTFVHDYLKVGSGWSDAHMNDSTGESNDTVYFGVAGDPISGPYVSPFQDHPSPNYNDFVSPYDGSGAVTCFYTQIDEESAGLHYSGPFKMVFLPWILEAVDDNAIGTGILTNVLTFFGEQAGVVNVPGASLPDRYSLEQNYPNPFNPSTQIRFTLPRAGKAELTVYNLRNQEVAKLVNGQMNAGAYQVTWDANRFASGIYFYTLKTDNFVQTRKMVMVK